MASADQPARRAQRMAWDGASDRRGRRLLQMGATRWSIPSDEVERVLAGEVYRDGLAQVLSEPEFAEVEGARKALRILEEAF